MPNRRTRALGIAALCVTVLASKPGSAAAAAPAGGEPVQDVVCRLIESAAHAENLPSSFLTRLIWQESSFRPNVESSAGAQGIAQFMPGTAKERGLIDPFDPAEAVPKAANLLAELRTRFGNLGLAAAAYNAGPARIDSWLAGRGSLPSETTAYVLSITRRPAEDWRAGVAATAPAPSTDSCLQTVDVLRRGNPIAIAASVLSAPWGVQLAGSFSKDAALKMYERARGAHPALLADLKPMILGGRVMSFGFKPYYRVRAPAPSRAAANALCKQLMQAGGACAVLRS